MVSNPLPPYVISALARRDGRIRVLVRVGADSWPDMAGKLLVYLPDSIDTVIRDVSLYLPDDGGMWVQVAADTLIARNELTTIPSRSQCERAIEAIEYELGTKVQAVKRVPAITWHNH